MGRSSTITTTPSHSAPTTTSPADTLESVTEERDALRAEVASLTEQLKKLVKVEHALTRSRRQLDGQLTRIRRLAQFALESTSTVGVDGVLDAARETLVDLFALDQAVVLSAQDALDAHPSQQERDACRAFVETLGPDIEDATNERAQCLLNVVAIAREETSPGTARTVLWVPLTLKNRGVVAVIVAWSSSTTSHHREIPSKDHVPFVQVFASHVTRALDNAFLHDELRAQGEALAKANRSLQQTVQDLERTQAQLVQAQKLEALGRLAGGIAHDFNNLLTVIVSHAALVRPALPTGSEALEDLDMIVGATRRATDITSRLLTFGRKQESSEGSTDLNALTTDLSKILRRLVSDDIPLLLDLDPSIVPVRAEPAQIEQIILNLVVNARDAMPSGGRLTITTRHARPSDFPPSATAPVDMVALTVSDTGVGMDEATRSQLFEPFFTTKPVGKGTGLGLATVYGLVNQNGGLIHVQSAPGQGSRFTVLLPSGARGSRVSGHVRSASSRGQVLVVEDEDAIRRMVCRVLRSENFDVVEARDGREALAVARKIGDVDLLVTDVVMPHIGGSELAGFLREQMPRLRVLFMSGHTFDRLDTEHLDPSTESFLRKPFTPDDLKAKVDLILLT